MKRNLLVIMIIAAMVATVGFMFADDEKKASLGVYLSMTVDELKDGSGDVTKTTAVVVDALVPGGAAEKAGLIKDDEILSFDGNDVTSGEELIELISAHAPGDLVAITVKRGEEKLSFDVTLGERQDMPKFAAKKIRKTIHMKKGEGGKFVVRKDNGDVEVIHLESIDADGEGHVWVSEDGKNISKGKFVIKTDDGDLKVISEGDVDIDAEGHTWVSSKDGDEKVIFFTSKDGEHGEHDVKVIGHGDADANIWISKEDGEKMHFKSEHDGENNFIFFSDDDDEMKNVIKLKLNGMKMDTKKLKIQMKKLHERMENMDDVELSDEQKAKMHARMSSMLEKMENIEIDFDSDKMKALHDKMENMEIHVDFDDEKMEALHMEKMDIHVEIDDEKMEALHEKMENMNITVDFDDEHMEKMHVKMEAMHGKMEMMEILVEACENCEEGEECDECKDNDHKVITIKRIGGAHGQHGELIELKELKELKGLKKIELMFDDDGKVTFNGKEFEDRDALKEYLHSDEFKAEHGDVDVDVKVKKLKKIIKIEKVKEEK
jgi:hypothetical protein